MDGRVPSRQRRSYLNPQDVSSEGTELIAVFFLCLIVAYRCCIQMLTADFYRAPPFVPLRTAQCCGSMLNGLTSST